MKIIRSREKKAWEKMKRDEVDQKIKDNNNSHFHGGGGAVVVTAAVVLLPSTTATNTTTATKLTNSSSSSSSSTTKTTTAAAEATTTIIAKKKTKPTPLLTPADKKTLAEKSRVKRKSVDTVLETVTQALLSISPHLFEPKIHKIAGLIVSLEKEQPLIKWNLRLLFHRAAAETGLTTWCTEFLVNKFHRRVPEENPFEKIKALWK